MIGSGPDSTKYWIVVASRDHVKTGASLGICQASHGKQGPLSRMKMGDWVVFYSPHVKFGGTEKCRKFTALARVKDDRVYQVRMSRDFQPFRRDVEFRQCREVPIEPLVAGLSFIKNKKSWGYVFRFGLLSIPREDFLAISSQMVPGGVA